MIFHAQNLNVCIDAKPEQWQVPRTLYAVTRYTAQKPRNRNTPQQVNGICRLLKPHKTRLLIWQRKFSYLCGSCCVICLQSFFFWKYVFPLLFYVHGFPRMQLDVLPQWIVLNCHVFSKWDYSMLFRCEFAVFFFQEGFHVFPNIIYCWFLFILFFHIFVCCVIDPRYQKRQIIYGKIVRWKNKIVR